MAASRPQLKANRPVLSLFWALIRLLNSGAKVVAWRTRSLPECRTRSYFLAAVQGGLVALPWIFVETISPALAEEGDDST
jgi:hypothetical protein